jgi:hypothetical protein
MASGIGPRMDRHRLIGWPSRTRMISVRGAARAAKRNCPAE